MHSDHDDETPVMKHDKTDTPSDVAIKIENSDSGINKKVDSKDPKPRIVLTFRSEKSGAKNSNMKIVSTEEKHEEISPRRSNRNRSLRWESDEDNDSLSMTKKELNISQSVSENDEASDSSHTTPKRSTRRRSKEFSENVLANAIARKEKSYNETYSGPTQRLSRRIKPTAKILANEELRMGLESQNNARLGIQSEKFNEEGVRTRRSAYSKNYDNTSGDKKAEKRHKSLREEMKQNKSLQAGDTSTSELKAKHLCKLGLKATSNIPDDEQSEENENRSVDGDENDPEAMEEDEEIDDDTEVISKLLEADEDSSDEDFLCPVDTSGSERPRRSTRQCSSYDNDSDQSSMSIEDDESKAPPRRSSRLRFSCSDFYDRDAAGPDEGDEAAYPLEQYPVVANCTCESSSNVYAAPDDLTEPVFCQAIETVDGVRVGCSHAAARLNGELQPLRRAGPRAPYFLCCKLHAAQLQRHMCCAACGLFCAQGIFYQCSLGHLFHIECGIMGSVERSGEVKQLPGCPHCGVHSVQWQPANRDCSRVKIEMHCSGKRVFLSEQREQSTPAYVTFPKMDPSIMDQGPLIPEDLLPSPPVDLKKLCETSSNENEETPTSKIQALHDAIIAGETAEQLIPKIVAAKSDGLDEAMGIAASHGRVAALYLLHFAGAKLDTVDSTQHTPLVKAIVALLNKSKTKADEAKKDDGPKEEAIEVEKENDQNEDKKDEGGNETKEEEQKNETKDLKVSVVNTSNDDLMKVIRYLVAAGCDVNLPGPDGMSALHIAAQFGGSAVCKLLLDEGHALVDARDVGGWTPLVWAAENSYSDVVRVLLERGADPVALDKEGNAAVHWCALHGDARSLRLLLDAAPHAHAALNAHADTPLKATRFRCAYCWTPRRTRTPRSKRTRTRRCVYTVHALCCSVGLYTVQGRRRAHAAPAAGRRAARARRAQRARGHAAVCILCTRSVALLDCTLYKEGDARSLRLLLDAAPHAHAALNAHADTPLCVYCARALLLCWTVHCTRKATRARCACCWTPRRTCTPRSTSTRIRRCMYTVHALCCSVGLYTVQGRRRALAAPAAGRRAARARRAQRARGYAAVSILCTRSVALLDCTLYKEGDARSLRLLLDAAPHAHAALNAHADTPLHVAARQGHYACVVILLARGARTDMENSAGELPVEICSGQCQTAISINMQMALAVSDKPLRCRLLSNDISNGRELYPVPCVNEIDDTPLPDDFTYVTRHVTPSPVPVDTSLSTLQGCECRAGECGGPACGCSVLGVRNWYSGDRLLPGFPFHDPPMLFECNETCACNLRQCNNRVVSRVEAGGSLGVRAQVFRSARSGWALRTLQRVRRGAPVALYCGELLPRTLADERPRDQYMFALDLKPDLLEVRVYVCRYRRALLRRAAAAQACRRAPARPVHVRARPQARLAGGTVALYCGELLPRTLADERPRDQYMFALDLKPDLLEVRVYVCRYRRALLRRAAAAHACRRAPARPVHVRARPQARLAGGTVALYCGELLPRTLADERPRDQYMFALDLKPDLLEECLLKQRLCVDAAAYGSAARFVNHSCRPALVPVRVFTRQRDLRLPVVALFAARDLSAGEELTFDYGDEFWAVKSKWMKCECGSPECRYPTKSIED
ncbi:unnamed protein product [Parnassius apollo]|uniref:(apollo) hypothetical protein n=1 Tax=Parnassius apollo TaxID=110799 RepID=A0A8S3XPK8_PARAO|nr:unnamed protein product [Parnassius apollo]